MKPFLMKEACLFCSENYYEKMLIELRNLPNFPGQEKTLKRIVLRSLKTIERDVICYILRNVLFCYLWRVRLIHFVFFSFAIHKHML